MNVCQYCNLPNNNIKKRRLNTRYVEDDRNFMISCKECYDETYAHYKELWDDYCSDCM